MLIIHFDQVKTQLQLLVIMIIITWITHACGKTWDNSAQCMTTHRTADYKL
jgi:hypothetical protein